jgi:hypothetical protein
MSKKKEKVKVLNIQVGKKIINLKFTEDDVKKLADHIQLLDAGDQKLSRGCGGGDIICGEM